MLKNNSTLRYVLNGFIPYTKQNLYLSYKPGKFFSDLERMSFEKTGRNISVKSLKSTYYRALENNYLEVKSKGIPRLTTLGEVRLKIFEPTKLKGAKLLVSFDIPETERYKRRELRQILFMLKFAPVQQSVWISDYDGASILKSEIKLLQIEDNVLIYEAKLI